MTELFDSVGKIRIINILAIFGELNITAITEKTGLNHVRLSQHLEELQKKYIIQEKTFGRIRIFRLNPSSLEANRLKTFFCDWNEWISKRQGIRNSAHNPRNEE